jgi:hypothetical protein
MRRGTSSACVKRMHSSSQTPKNACSLEDTSFARSRDPCTSIVTQLSGTQVSGGGAAIRYRGRANLGNQEEPAPGSNRTDACAARRVSPCSQEQQRGTFRKGRWSWPSSLRGNESSGLAPVRRLQLQKSAGSILASNKLERSALQKGGGSSERGPRRRGIWHESVSHRVDRNDVWRSAFAQVIW